MQALVKTAEGRGHVGLMEVDEPAPGPGEVKILVKAAGICGTDIKILHGDTWSNPPVILGHEYSGIVTEIGTGVTSVEPGDRVVSETAQKVCGTCYYCKTSRYLMCPERLSIGYGVNGAFTSYCVVREAIVHKLPDQVSFDAGALCEPTAVAVHAVYDTGFINPTEIVVVIGPGPIGLLTAQVAKSFGCAVVLVGTASDVQRLSLAKSLGIDVVVNGDVEDPVDIILKLSSGIGADRVFDCTGVGQAINTGLSFLKKTGTLVQVGLTKPSLEINYGLLTQKELSILGTFGHTWKSWSCAIQLIGTGKLNVEKLISHRFDLKEWEEAFRVAEDHSGIKILLYPSETSHG